MQENGKVYMADRQDTGKARAADSQDPGKIGAAPRRRYCGRPARLRQQDGGTERRGGAAPHPSPNIVSFCRAKWEEVATMTDLVLLTAILELIASAVHLAAAIIERLPVRKGKEQ